MQRQILRGEVGGYWKLDWVLDILQWEEERSVLHCHGNCSGVSPPSLSVLPRDLNGKPLKVTTTATHAFDRRGERGKGRWGADSGVAEVTPQKVDCLWGGSIGNVSIHFNGQRISRWKFQKHAKHWFLQRVQSSVGSNLLQRHHVWSNSPSD